LTKGFDCDIVEKIYKEWSKMIFTSESVTEGHPDKVADQISDAVLDEVIAQDPMGRVACETLVTTGQVHVVGEISTNCYVDINKVIRKTIREIGYTDSHYGFDADTVGVLISIDEQSPDIAQGVNDALESRGTGQAIGAGDQGMMFGYATNETPEYMPIPISLAHKLTRRLAEVRKSTKEINYLRPDGKSQVTIEYNEKGEATRVDTIVLSTQHSPSVSLQQIEKDIVKYIIEPVIPENLLKNTRYFINPTGKFVIGGPQGDAGLTGRKIIVDTYGGTARHGGGAFSGKDPTKVDRSAAYAARWVAKNIVAAGLSDKCELQLAYAIGVAEPVSIRIETFGTGKVPESKLEEAVKKTFDLTPSGIIKELDLRRPIYKQTAAYGHFGRLDIELPWEQLNRIEALQKNC
jgi:S-adenosylmethionine synthetase